MKWTNNGAKNGLWFEVTSEIGVVIEVARPENADMLVLILNSLEQRALRVDNFYRVKRQLERLDEAINDIIGHGVTLPLAGQYSEEFAKGYERGVDSQRRIAKDARNDL